MIRMKNQFLVLIMFCLLSAGSWAQTVNRAIDSLLIVLETAKDDTGRVNCLNELAWQLSLLGDNEQSLNYGKAGLALAESLHYKIGISKASNTIGNYHSKKGNYPEAIKYFEDALKHNIATG